MFVGTVWQVPSTVISEMALRTTLVALLLVVVAHAFGTALACSQSRAGVTASLFV